MLKYLKSLAGKYITSSASGYLSIALIALILSSGLGAFYGLKSGFVFLADERCEGLVSVEKVEEAQNELAAVKAAYAKRTAIKQEVQNATKNSNDLLSPNISRFIDCLHYRRAGKKCVSADTGTPSTYRESDLLEYMIDAESALTEKARK